MIAIGDRVPVYKLLRADLTSYGGYSWAEPGQVHRFSGKGPLCGLGHAHVYTSPEVALWLRPLHVNGSYTRLVPGVGIVSRTDRGLKLGVQELILDLSREIVIPPGVPRLAHLLTAAIRASLVVYPEPSYHQWAERWLVGADRSAEAAEVVAARAASEAAAASASESGAAWAASDASDATAHAASAAAATRAARAAKAAAKAAEAAAIPLDLDAIARDAITGLERC